MIIKIVNSKMIYYIYCDESGTTKHKYMVIGGICFNKTNYDIINNTISKYRITNNMQAELKFSKISKQKEKEYKNFIDYIFALINNGYMEFKSIIVDKTNINEKTYKKFKNNNNDNKSNNELFFQTMYFELLYNSFTKRIVEENSELYFYLDKRKSKYNLENMKKWIQEKNNYDRKNVSYMDSKTRNYKLYSRKKRNTRLENWDTTIL